MISGLRPDRASAWRACREGAALTRHVGSSATACATTDTAAAIAAHAAQGACPRICGTARSTASRRPLPADAYNPMQAEASAALMAIQEALSFTKMLSWPGRPKWC